MPTVYLKKQFYDQIVELGLDVSVFVNSAVEDQLKVKTR